MSFANDRMILQQRRRFLAAATLPALAALPACTLGPPADLKTPSLAFGSLAVPRVGLDRIDFRVTVLADNPNDIDIPLRNLRFDLDLLGQPFASGGSADPTVTLPRLASTEVPIAFSVPTSQLADLLSRVRNPGADGYQYRLRGSANWGRSPLAIPFQKTGELDALRRLGALLR